MKLLRSTKSKIYKDQNEQQEMELSSTIKKDLKKCSQQKIFLSHKNFLHFQNFPTFQGLIHRRKFRHNKKIIPEITDKKIKCDFSNCPRILRKSTKYLDSYSLQLFFSQIDFYYDFFSFSSLGKFLYLSRAFFFAFFLFLLQKDFYTFCHVLYLKKCYEKHFDKLQRITLKYDLCKLLYLYKLYELCTLYELCKLHELCKLYNFCKLYKLCRLYDLGMLYELYMQVV